MNYIYEFVIINKIFEIMKSFYFLYFSIIFKNI